MVDDASADGTHSIASEMASVDKRIRVVRHPDNRGAYAARNTGLACTTGSVVTTLDSDDYAHPDLIKAADGYFPGAAQRARGYNSLGTSYRRPAI